MSISTNAYSIRCMTAFRGKVGLRIGDYDSPDPYFASSNLKALNYLRHMMAYGPVTGLVLDVGPLWPLEHHGGLPFRSTELWVRNEKNKEVLQYLPSAEQAKVLAFVRHTDAKLCLGSCLLKRRAISEACGVPWSDITISEDGNRKPCYQPTDPSSKAFEFNVSHHGSVVALVGCVGEDLKLGVDVVRVDMEKDYPKVLREGFESWARTYEAVFSDRETEDIINYTPSGTMSSNDQVRAKLRHFYAHWCLKEAYVKMTGEALMAKWLRQVEFRNVKVPAASSADPWGEVCTQVEVWANGKRVDDVTLHIQAFREDYMLAVCASTPNVVTNFQLLEPENDIYPRAH